MEALEVLAPYIPALVMSAAVIIIALKIPKEDLKELLISFMSLSRVLGIFGFFAYVIGAWAA